MVPDTDWLDSSEGGGGGGSEDGPGGVVLAAMNRSDRNRLARCRQQIASDLDVLMVRDTLIADGVLDNRAWQIVESEVME